MPAAIADPSKTSLTQHERVMACAGTLKSSTLSALDHLPCDGCLAGTEGKTCSERALHSFALLPRSLHEMSSFEAQRGSCSSSPEKPAAAGTHSEDGHIE